MTQVFKPGFCFESGGTEGLVAAANLPTVVTSPAPPHANETYCGKFSWKATGVTESYTLGTSGEWVTVSFPIRFTDMSPPADQNFAFFEDNLGYCWRLRMKTGSTGRIVLVDANNVEQDISDSGWAADTWYTITVKFKHDNSTDIEVWRDGDMVLDDTAFDASSGGTTGRFVATETVDGSPNPHPFFYCPHAVVIEDDGTAIDDEATINRVYYHRSYQNSTQGSAGDWGTVLDFGDWSDAGETPGNDGTDCRYDLPLNTTKNGGINCNDGARTGPKDDGVIGATDEIVGALWSWRVANGVATAFGRARFYGQYGKDDGPVITDTTSVLIPVGTTKYNYHVSADAGDSECPTKTDYIGVGMKGNKGAFGIAARLDLFDQWGQVCFREALPVTDVQVGVVHAGMIDA